MDNECTYQFCCEASDRLYLIGHIQILFRLPHLCFISGWCLQKITKYIIRLFQSCILVLTVPESLSIGLSSSSVEKLDSKELVPVIQHSLLLLYRLVLTGKHTWIAVRVAGNARIDNTL